MRAQWLLAVALVVASCQDHQAAGDQLANELPGLYPEQITAIAFENNPPMDPPTLFVDLAPTMDAQDQLEFLCTELAPRIRSVDRGISATVSSGWWLEDCPDT